MINLLADPAAEAQLTDSPRFQDTLLRQVVVRSEPPLQPAPLWPGTEQFAEPWLVEWHASQHAFRSREVACYYAKGAVVSGDGELWVRGKLLSSPELLPEYKRRLLELERGGSAELRARCELPLRTIERPCISAVGHGTHVYGHFLVEMVPRLAVALAAIAGADLQPSILLAADSPKWLLQILTGDLGITQEQFEFFDAESERVQLRNAIIPELLYNEEGFHPATTELVRGVIQPAPAPQTSTAERIYISRATFTNPRHDGRKCVNEAALLEVASEHGFLPVALETMPWMRQVELFANASVVVGLFGSGLLNALFSGAGARVGAVGRLNLMQSHVGSLRQHRNAYLHTELQLEYRVDEEMFRAFLAALVADPAAVPTADA